MISLLLDSEFSHTAILALCFVDAAIGTTADEAHDLVALVDSLFGVITGKHDRSGFDGIRCRWIMA